MGQTRRAFSLPARLRRQPEVILAEFDAAITAWSTGWGSSGRRARPRARRRIGAVRVRALHRLEGDATP